MPFLARLFLRLLGVDARLFGPVRFPPVGNEAVGGFGDTGLGGGERVTVGCPGPDRRAFLGVFGDGVVKPGPSRLELGDAAVGVDAPGLGRRHLFGQLGKASFKRGERRVGGEQRRLRFLLGAILLVPRAVEPGAFLVEPGDRLGGVGCAGLLALDVGADLEQTPLAILLDLVDAGLLGVQGLPRQPEPL